MDQFQVDPRYSFVFVGPLNPAQQTWQWDRMLQGSQHKGAPRFFGVCTNVTPVSDWHDNHTTKGHWVAFLVDWNTRTLEFFDPKGHAAAFYPIVKTMLSDLHLALEQYDDQAAWNLEAGSKRCHQAGDTECGMHVIRFFAWRLHCKSLTDVHTATFPDAAAHLLRDVYFEKGGLPLQGPTCLRPEEQLLDLRTLEAVFAPQQQTIPPPPLKTTLNHHGRRRGSGTVQSTLRSGNGTHKNILFGHRTTRR